MAQRDRVAADEYFFRHEPEYLLSLSHLQRFSAGAQFAAKASQALGQL